MIMMKLIFITITITCLMFFVSCSTIEKIAVSSSSPMINKASSSIEMEGSWESFKEGVPGNLKLLEGLLSISPEDDDLLLSLVKGYSGYAFAVNETEDLTDKFKDKEKRDHADLAAINYSKAIGYGLRYLQESGVSYEMLSKAQRDESGISNLLSRKFGHTIKNHEALFFTAQAIGGLINIRKDKMILVSQISVVRGMIDWVCSNDPDFYSGLCEIFYGAYETGRPKMLGGDPDKGRKIFQDAIKKYPDNWMIRTAYIEHYLIPMMKEDEFAKELAFFEKAAQAFQASNEWSPVDNHLIKNSQLRLYQAVAMKRYELINVIKKTIF